jgi:hypothetical protein
VTCGVTEGTSLEVVEINLGSEAAFRASSAVPQRTTGPGVSSGAFGAPNPRKLTTAMSSLPELTRHG